MARPIPSRQQQIPEAGIRGGTNTAFQMKAQNLMALNEFAQEVTDPIANSIIADEAEADRLAKFELEKDLPIEQIEPVEGGFNPLSLSKWGKAYDRSYNELDKQLIAFKADEALTEAFANLSRPESVGPGITKSYNEEASKIIDAYVQSAAPGNRTDLMVKLTNRARNNEFRLAETEASHNRAQIKSQLDMTVQRLSDELDMAAQQNDVMKIAYIANEFENNIVSQQNLGFISPEEAKHKKEVVASQARKSLIVGQWTDAEASGKGPEFLADVALHPEKYDITINEAQGAVETILRVKNFQERATADYYTLQGLKVESDLSAGLITNPLELGEYDLTDKQVLKYEAAINNNNAKLAKQEATVTNARLAIESGQSAGLDKKVISSMTNEAWLATADDLGRPLTLMEKSQSITGSPGARPASGIPGLSLKTNDPGFDRIVNAALTSRDPNAMISAYQVYQDMVITKDQPNTLKLGNDELRVAITMKSLINGGVSPDIAAQRAIESVLDKDEAGMAIRIKEFNKQQPLEKLPGAFRDTFDVDSDQNQQIFGDFVTQVRVNFAHGMKFDDAVEATKQNMRAYQESKYFVPGRIGQLAPEKNLPIVGYEFDNQFAATLQNIINNGGTGAGGVPIEWANPEDAIDLATLQPENLIEEPLPAVSYGSKNLFGNEVGKPESNLFGNKNLTSVSRTRLPEIKIGDHVSPVYLIAGDRVRYGDNGRPLYQLGYKDQVGNLEPLTDGRGPNSAATFSPVDITKFAPKYYGNYTKGVRMEKIKRAASKPFREAVSEFNFTTMGHFKNFADTVNAAESIEKNEQLILEGLNAQEGQE